MTGAWLRTRAVLATLLALATLSGCSMLRFGYGQLDTFAAWQANDYFDLDGQQRDEFRTRFARLHEWHRYEQLPEYAGFVAEFRARLQRGLAREDVIWFVEGLKTRYRAIARRGGADAAALLATITPEQLEVLRRQWDKDNRSFMREYRLVEDLGERRRARAQRALAQVRDWTGGLTHEQEQRIIALAHELPMIDHLRHEDRLRRQSEFLELMKRRTDRDLFPQRLTQWLLEWERGRTTEYDRALTDWWSKRVDFFVAVDRMLTAHQRATAMHRLQDYVEDFTQLSQRPQPAAAASR